MIHRYPLKTLIALFFLIFAFPMGGAAQVSGSNGSAPLPLESITTFARVFETIKNNYIEDVSDEKLLRDAIHGMIAGLDPHSALLTAREMSDIQIETTGRYGGLGIEITKESDGIRVISPIDDTPAYNAGILPGDLIIRLDNRPISRMSLMDAVNIMRGEPGTEITLTIIRQGSSAPLEFTLTRAVIKVTSVRGFFLEPDFGYLRITQFQTTTPELARTQIKRMLENSSDFSGLVLDLRNNPGGELHSAIGVSDIFIDRGLIVSTRNRDGSSVNQFRSTPGDMLDGIPVVVLVNEGSASASEIVAGALQDHQRAIIMGQNTFGKGSVQTIVRIGNNTSLKLTTDRYYTPNDRSIQASGIIPDIMVERREFSEDEQAGIQTLRESDLEGSLENENAADPDLQDVTDSMPQVNPAVRGDYQLQEALNLLKGLQITRQWTGTG